jgi:HEAT repeat protein
LFLRRVNLAKDLTATLRGVEDPGEVTLKAGGVGGEGLLAKGLKSSVVMGDKGRDTGALTNLDSEAARLCFELIQASAEQQDQVLEKLKGGKGPIFTDALGAAIPQLTGAARSRARDALAERLGLMTAETLRNKLQDDLTEVRRAAAMACYMKDDKAHVPDLIPLLDDAEPAVVRAAHAALKGLTGQDFGPAKDAGVAERGRAVADWKAWWKKQPK